jgi:hypothetical protein
MINIQRPITENIPTKNAVFNISSIICLCNVKLLKPVLTVIKEIQIDRSYYLIE